MGTLRLSSHTVRSGKRGFESAYQAHTGSAPACWVTALLPPPQRVKFRVSDVQVEGLTANGGGGPNLTRGHPLELRPLLWAWPGVGTWEDRDGPAGPIQRGVHTRAGCPPFVPSSSPSRLSFWCLLIFLPLPPSYFGHVLCLTFTFSSFGNPYSILHTGSSKVVWDNNETLQASVQGCSSFTLRNTAESQVKKTAFSRTVTSTPFTKTSWLLYLRLYPE